MRLAAPTEIRRNGTMKEGEIIQAARRTPYSIGSVRQPPAASPFMSAKSLVVEAPSRNRPKIAPMNHGSRPNTVLTHDQPATFSRTPRGIAMVMLAQMPRFLVRSGGHEYTNVAAPAARAIPKHSGGPAGGGPPARGEG